MEGSTYKATDLHDLRATMTLVFLRFGCFSVNGMCFLVFVCFSITIPSLDCLYDVFDSVKNNPI